MSERADFGAGLSTTFLKSSRSSPRSMAPRGRADQLDVVLLEHARLAQRHGRVQRGLSAQRRQQRVRTFLGDDLLEDRGGDRPEGEGVASAFPDRS